jgi:hypothetical protein
LKLIKANHPIPPRDGYDIRKKLIIAENLIDLHKIREISWLYVFFLTSYINLNLTALHCYIFFFFSPEEDC